MHFRYGFRVHEILRNILPMTISAAAMGVTGYFLRQLDPSIVWQIISVIICAVVYFAILIGAFPSVRRDLAEAGSSYRLEKIDK